MADIEWLVSEGVATLTLNRPERRNAFTFDMVEQWADNLRLAQEDELIRAVIITGAGDSFCAGVDLDSISSGNKNLSPLERKNQLHERIHKVAREVERLDKPLIAAMNGPAVGAGLDMALMCDLRIADPAARFAEGYVTVGLVPGDGGAYYLTRIVGISKALEMLLTGEFVEAAEALRIGLVNRVAEPGRALDEATQLARKIADLPPVTVRTIKRLTYQSMRIDLQTSLDLASSHFAVVASTEDAGEALSAYREKRAPKYLGK